MFSRVLTLAKGYAPSVVFHPKHEIDPLDQLLITHSIQDQSRLTITQLNSDDMALGKGLCQLLQSGDLDLSQVDQLELNFFSPAFSLFSMYSKFPPGAFGKGIAKGTALDVNLLTNRAALGLIYTACNSWPDKVETLWDDSAATQYILPSGAFDHVRLTLERTQADLLHMTARDTLVQEEIRATYSKIKEYIADHCIEDVSRVSSHYVDMAIDRDSRLLEPEILDLLAGNFMRFSKTDETTLLAYSNGVLKVFDAGYPSTPADIENIIKVAQAQNIPLERVSFFVSHGHIDHIANLVKGIELAVDRGVKVDLSMSRDCLMQFIGMYVLEADRLRPLLARKQLEIALVKKILTPDTVMDRFACLTPIIPPEFEHYIKACGTVDERADGSAIAFTSDMSLKFGQNMADQRLRHIYYSYFADLIAILAKRGNKVVHLFQDIDPGHLPGMADFLPEFRLRLMTHASDLGIVLNINEAHLKNQLRAAAELINVVA